MRRKTKARRDQMINMIALASGCFISSHEIRFKHLDPLYKSHIYSIMMPVTLQWEDISIPDIFIMNKTLPIYVCDLIDQINQTKLIMSYARDLQVFSEDIKPISDEERRRFGARPYTHTWIP